MLNYVYNRNDNVKSINEWTKMISKISLPINSDWGMGGKWKTYKVTLYLCLANTRKRKIDQLRLSIKISEKSFHDKWKHSNAAQAYEKGG